jgi:DNA-directed RNA polymerase specialized sigma24 family protein
MASAADINNLFAKYAEHPSPELHGQLFMLCQDLATPMRLKFGAPNKVNGDRLDEAVEKAFLRLTSPPKLVEIRADHFSNLFLISARNALLDTMRKVGRERGLVTSYSDLGKHPPPEPQKYDSPSYDISPFRRRVLARLEHLPTNTLDAFCRYLEGPTLEEVAMMQGVPLGTVKSRIHRVRQALEPLANAAYEHQPSELEGLSDIIPELRAMINTRLAKTAAMTR